MLSKKINKLQTAILILMVLVKISSAETTTETLATTIRNDKAVEWTTTTGNVVMENPTTSHDVLVDTSKETTNSNDNNPNHIETSTNVPSNTESIKSETTNEQESATQTVTIAQAECNCDCTANGNQFKLGCTTKMAENIKTEIPEENTTSFPNTQTTTAPVDKTSMTETANESNPESESTTPSEATVQTTTEAEITTSAPSIPCSAPGVQAHETDCKQYYECSPEESKTDTFRLHPKSCTKNQAFNIELQRCSRDISSCPLPIQCPLKGAVADPASTTSYYFCEPRLIGVGHRVFHVDCAPNEIFYPELSKCFIDVNNLNAQNFATYTWNQIKDVDIVKAEMKLLKAQDKLKLKEEKERKKTEENLQKKLNKELRKRFKVEEKANKDKFKQQSVQFVCTEEGNFPAQIGENSYIACVNKKGQLKPLNMQCNLGTKFDPVTGSCVNNGASVNVSVSEDDDNDDDD